MKNKKNQHIKPNNIHPILTPNQGNKQNKKSLIKKILKPTVANVFWIIITIIITIPLTSLLSPMIIPLVNEQPELEINVFKTGISSAYTDGLEVGNISWNNKYNEYTVMIQQDSSKAKSTAIDDIYITFDFNASILSLYSQENIGLTNPTVQLSQSTVFGKNITTISPIKPLQVIVDISRLKPEGLCAFTIIIDPTNSDGTIRTNIINPLTFQGSYYYSISGTSYKKTLNGSIPSQ